jgi:hypothetical protein
VAEPAPARRPIRPEDVVEAAAYVRETLAPAIGMDWSVRAGRLEWDVDFTITHLTAAAAKYTLYLASRSTRFIAVRLDKWRGATQAEQVDAMVGVAHALANVAAVTPPTVRAFHANGMFDAEGYVAMACSEMLVHGYDAATGLRLDFEPPDDLCRAVVGRLYPWLTGDDEGAWRAMLWHTGRIELPGREPHDDDTWTCLADPISEWDGTIPADDPGIVVEWIEDDEGVWRPRYLEDSEDRP